ncbi:hypothetical protein CBE79_04205 [Priestia megaterium]|nr:hypothetical protein CBE78_01700 [Priestia megaterium]TPF22072.1 hypothetical protein CBE79_04205 [Priestia megaterium]
MNDSIKLFYCYSKALHKYLHNVHNVKYLCTALHEHTKNKFWLYERTPQLNSLIREYEESNKNV